MKISRYWKILRILIRYYRKRFKKDYGLALQNVEDELYEVNLKVEPYLKAVSFFLVFVAFLTILIPFGFRLSNEMRDWNRILEIVLLHGFVFFFVLRVILTARRIVFIKKRWFEVVLTIFAVIIILSFWISDFTLHFGFLESLGIANPGDWVLGAVKIYLFLLVSIKVIQGTPALLDIENNTGRLLVISFMLLILFGALVLMMPRMTVDEQGLSFVDALFTSTSAVCVTGLIVVDTARHFTFLGQFVIMLLIQFGGIGIVTFATFFAIFLRSGLGVGQMTFVREILQEESVNEIFGTLRRIIGLTLFIELIGAVSFYFSWRHLIPDPFDRAWFAIFHSISAFCNAGFSLFTNSLADHVNVINPGVNITTMLLIIFGGLGFTTIWELGSNIKRGKPRTYGLSVHSRLVLITTLVLIVSGAVTLIATEWNGIMAGYTGAQKVMIAFFQSVTTRTAGFNTVDIGRIGPPATMFMMILMFLGASPGSTGGGIKTTTIAVLALAVGSTIRGHKRIEVARKTLPVDVVFEALTALILGVTLVFGSTLLLTVFEHHNFVDLLFEEISAFATVGLSRGVTPQLDSIGKIILVLSMYTGRVGSITLAVAFAKKIDKRKYRYPKESVLVS